MENKPRYAVGDSVSVRQWDMTERPENHIGSPATVTKISKEHCGTGFMLRVKGTSGREGYLDQDWVTPWVSPMEGVQP